jgi:DNA repair exonuclease SbcCD ATPase subunit
MEVPSMPAPTILTPSTLSPRPSVDSNGPTAPNDAPLVGDLETSTSQSPETLEADFTALQKTHEETLRDHRDEMNAHLERIDALQSKLTYLSQQLASSAKSASTDASATPADKKMAEKDAQIAALMEEGQKLSKTEMKHLTTIKKMRAKAQETDKEIAAIKQRLSKAEKSVAEQTDRAKRAEAAEKAAQEKLKIVSKIEKDLEAIKAEREEAGLTIAELRRQLNDALSKAEDADKRVQAGALEAEKRVTASLKEDIENLRIEKKLAEDRVKRELQEAKDDAARRGEKANVVELELRGEIAVRCLQPLTTCRKADSVCRILRPSWSSSVAVLKKSPFRPQGILRRNSFVRLKRCRHSTRSLPKTGKALRAPSRRASQHSRKSGTKSLSVNPM